MANDLSTHKNRLIRSGIGLFDGKHVVSFAVFCGLELFGIGSIIYAAMLKETSYILLCAVTPVLFLLPYIAERMFSVRFSVFMEISLMMFCSASMVGHVYKLYYLLPDYDKMLHTFCGFITAAIGYYIPDTVDRKNAMHSKALRYLSAFCFSMAVAVIWEFFEYGMDTFFFTDMQSDSVITRFSSYLLAGNTGFTQVVDEIRSVVVNGQELSAGGYIDIGLTDTMEDMLVCVLGTLLFLVAAIPKNGRWVSWTRLTCVKE